MTLFKNLLLLGSLTLVASLAAQESTIGHQSAKRFEGTFSKKLDYLLYLPDDYDSDETKKWPLLMFLHGAGERGDHELDKITRHGPPKLIKEGRKFPFIVGSPQCPKDGWWEPDTVMGLIENLEKSYRIDTNRIYLAGLSMGGYGTWETAWRNPDKFAAILPICGGGMPYMVGKQLSSMPIWCFHGAKDGVIPLSQSGILIEELKKRGNERIKFTVYPEAGHDAWTETFANDAVFDWLLSQAKNSIN